MANTSLNLAIEQMESALDKELGKENRDSISDLLQRFDKNDENFLPQLGHALGEPTVRRIISMLFAVDSNILPRIIARPLSRLSSHHTSASSLVLQQLRFWQANMPYEAPEIFFASMAETSAPLALEALLEGKVFGNERIRKATAHALGLIKPTLPYFSEARLIIADILLHDTDLSVRREAALSLDKYFSALDQPVLLRLSFEMDPELRNTLKTLWARKQSPEKNKADENQQRNDRTLRYYVRVLGDKSAKQSASKKILFSSFKEFENKDSVFAVEGQEDREEITPFFSEKRLTPDGCIQYTLHDGVMMTEYPNGSISFPIGKGDWRTRNSITGTVTIRTPADQNFEKIGVLTYFLDGMLKIDFDSGESEEEYLDGRRVVINTLGLIQMISPRAEQGIQLDTRTDLLEKHTEQYFIILEHGTKQIDFFGGKMALISQLPEGATKAIKLPYGAIRVEYRDGRVTREIVTGEMNYQLIGDRYISFIPKNRVVSVHGVKIFEKDGRVITRYNDGTGTDNSIENGVSYQLHDGNW